MGDQGQGNIANGDRCEVVGGTHRGKAGTVADYKLSKTGHATITVKQDSGVCFKTLARNVEKRG
jgi:ribosomal protein S4E